MFDIEYVKQVTAKVSHLTPVYPPNEPPQGITLSQNAKQIFLPSFVMGIIGGPGSGKSSFINHLMNEPDLFNKRYQRVLFVGPTHYKGLIQDSDNHISTFDLTWIYQKLVDASQWKCKNLLIIFDDVISSFKSNQSRAFIDLFNNRRHILKTGTVSIITTAQKWNMLPTFIRNQLSLIVLFKVPRQQQKVLGDELALSTDKATFGNLISNLKKHEFIFINNESGGIYDYKWTMI